MAAILFCLDVLKKKVKYLTFPQTFADTHSYPVFNSKAKATYT